MLKSYIATEKARGLRPGVLEIIEAEILKRDLNPTILEGAKAQNRQYSVAELTTLSQKIRSLPCPICGQKTRKLNGTVLHTVKSFILFSTFKQLPIIACPDCLDTKNQEAITSTALLGWWGFPSGFLKTPFYIYYNLKAKKQNKSAEPNETLLSFILHNIGEIEAYKEDPEKLKRIIRAVK